MNTRIFMIISSLVLAGFTYTKVINRKPEPPKTEDEGHIPSFMEID